MLKRGSRSNADGFRQLAFGGVTVDFVAGVGFRFFACGSRLIGGGFRGFRGFRLLAGPDEAPLTARLRLSASEDQVYSISCQQTDLSLLTV